MNDPITYAQEIRSAVHAGHMIRTRSDVDSEQFLTLDYTRAHAALESGAHAISTDYPSAPMTDSYGVIIPEGSPSRCNPLTAPPECRSNLLEDPDQLSSVSTQ